MRRSRRFRENSDRYRQSNNPLTEKFLNDPPVDHQFEMNCKEEYNGKFGSVVINKLSTPDRMSLKFTTPLLTMRTPSESTAKYQKEIFSPKEYFENDEKSLFIAHKQQQILQPGNLRDVTFHEVRIHKALIPVSKLTPGFTYLFKWYKSQNDGNNKQLMMNYIMESGGKSLYSFVREKKKMPFSIYQSIVFQVMFTLYVAQRECGFVHNDLHVKNILVKDLKNSWMELRTLGCKWYVRDVLVKITDFGHSRVQLRSGEIIYNEVRPISQVFDPSVDLLKLKDEMRGIPIIGMTPEQKKRKTNLMRNFEKIRKPHDIFTIISCHDFFNELRKKPK